MFESLLNHLACELRLWFIAEIMHITSTLLVGHNCLISCVMCEVKFAKGYRSHDPDFVHNIQHALFGIIGIFIICEPSVSCASTMSRCNRYHKPPNQRLLVSGNKHGFVGLRSHVTGNEVVSWLDTSWSHKSVSNRADMISPVSPWSIPPQQRVPEKLLISKKIELFQKLKENFEGKE